MRKLIATAGIALIILLAVSPLYAAGQGDSAEEPVVQLRLAHVQAERSPTGQGTYRFAELVEEYTDGTVTIEVFPASQLGNNSEIFSSVQTGAVDMSITPFPVMADIVPELSVYLAGYFFENHEQQMKVLNHPDYGQAWNQRLVNEGGLRVVGTMLYGFRTLTTTNTPVYSPADLRGLRLRAVPNTMSLAVARGLGGEPTSVAFAELFEALRQGVVDAQENPLPTIKSNNFNEVQDYLILTRHQLVSLPWVINETSFQRLSENQQEALLRAAADAGEYTTSLTIAEEESLVDELAASGMTVIGVEEGLDLEAFRTQVQAEVMRAFADEWPAGLAEEVLALVGN